MPLESGTYIISSVSSDTALGILPFGNDGDSSMSVSIGTLADYDTAPKWKIVTGRDSSGKEVYHIYLNGVGRAVSHNRLLWADPSKNDDKKGVWNLEYQEQHGKHIYTYPLFELFKIVRVEDDEE
ncbi:hypothetical protein EST38_g12157 [Candolleomyces aberdarensis]|uniref:Uncharacterized protein n=1 Tax=Candolleomyces aberdarensis TaxID=2316362 RepID=A0A4Q2D366_9AGAR|nr:hypothetical protein EST38_g12157 [Candolleomyces aberdarensis]